MLEDIMEYKINEIRARQRHRSLESIKELLKQTENCRPVRDFKAALSGESISLYC